MVYSCSLSTWKAETGGPGVPGHAEKVSGKKKKKTTNHPRTGDVVLKKFLGVMGSIRGESQKKNEIWGETNNLQN